jgi:plasmid rolling circle replication initiator protein Rep
MNMAEPFADVKDGKLRPWREHKMNNQLLSAAYLPINTSKAHRLRECATHLIFENYMQGGLKLRSANFCRVRLCPMCTWRRSLKIYGQCSKIVKQLEGEFEYILLTLTVPNVGAKDLCNGLMALSYAWHRYTGYPEISAIAKGYYKAMEVTHNVKAGTFHPHFHVLVAVMPSYFNSRYYLSREKWLELWNKANYREDISQVDVRKVKGNTVEAIAEVAKYAVKSADYIYPNDWDLTVNTVALLDSALANRRFVSYGGAFAMAHRELNLGDVEKDLINTDGDEVFTGNFAERSVIWHAGYNQFYYAGK